MSSIIEFTSPGLHFVSLRKPNILPDGRRGAYGFSAMIKDSELGITSMRFNFKNIGTKDDPYHVPLVRFKSLKPIPILGISVGFIRDMETLNFDVDQMLNGVSARIVASDASGVTPDGQRFAYYSPLLVEFQREPDHPTYKSLVEKWSARQ